MIDSRYVTVGTEGTIVVFDNEIGDLEIVSSGADELYVAINPDEGFVMSARVDGTYWLPVGALSRIVPTHNADRVVVHLQTATTSIEVCLIPSKGN